MTKQDYIALATALHEVRPHIRQRDMERIFETIASICLADNPRFDRKRFHDAIYKGEIIERPGCKPKPLGVTQ